MGPGVHTGQNSLAVAGLQPSADLRCTVLNFRTVPLEWHHGITCLQTCCSGMRTHVHAQHGLCQALGQHACTTALPHLTAALCLTVQFGQPLLTQHIESTGVDPLQPCICFNLVDVPGPCDIVIIITAASSSVAARKGSIARQKSALVHGLQNCRSAVMLKGPGSYMCNQKPGGAARCIIALLTCLSHCCSTQPLAHMAWLCALHSAPAQKLPASFIKTAAGLCSCCLLLSAKIRLPPMYSAQTTLL